MKALVLAAGKGTRLRPLTDRCPKPMIPVAGLPLLERVVTQLRDAGIADLLINLHHCPEVVTTCLGDGSRFGVRISYSYEPELLGTAGAAKKLEAHLTERFLLYYGDNFVEIDLGELIRAHQDRGGLGTIAVFTAEETSASGVVEVDDAGRIRRFLEKPEPGETVSRLVNAGIYVLEPRVLAVIPPGVLFDFGRDLFPALLADGQPLYTFHLSGLVLGIDTPEALARLEAYLAQGGK